MGGMLPRPCRTVAVTRLPPELIATKGAVSPEVAVALAEGIRRRVGSTIGVGITGIAGPGGGSKQKPVGLVYFAAASRGGRRVARERRFGQIGRLRVRLRSVAQALVLLEVLAKEKRA